ncbi:MAG TPA: deoxyribodipyrimidine photo-lyase [Cyclobacteriaceae bacterium]|nr:deoxyribodipyrimidine photo-lyase [Cyclobacteriaceae bacterium]
MRKFNVDLATKYVDQNTALCWLRRDLRLTDHASLYHALKENNSVQLIFIFDNQILDKLDDAADARVHFIHECLEALNQELIKNQSSLLVLSGNPVEIFRSLNPKCVYANHDYEPYAISRDDEVRKILKAKRIIFKTYKDQVIFEKDEVVKDDGAPYTVFTPFSKKWISKIDSRSIKSHPVEKYLKNLRKTDPPALPSLKDIGFKKTNIVFPPRLVKSAVIESYDKTRNFPSIDGTSKLSVHLRFGTISIRKLVQMAMKKNDVWLNELIWREFYMMILWHFPHIETKAFKPAYDQIEWRNDPGEFAAWCDGQTGYPIVDAGMRELNNSGYMHNRVRMITASFLTKHLLIDWRWGEAYFAKKLLDFDLAANNGGWQWAAGSGCDAAPYFRVFNPALQAEKFDPEYIYINKWVPEVKTKHYSKPIVDHAVARARVLKAYAPALNAKSISLQIK